jgi:hypothetical protein
MVMQERAVEGQGGKQAEIMRCRKRYAPGGLSAVFRKQEERYVRGRTPGYGAAASGHAILTNVQ